jgi:hypothetical protein
LLNAFDMNGIGHTRSAPLSWYQAKDMAKIFEVLGNGETQRIKALRRRTLTTGLILRNSSRKASLMPCSWQITLDHMQHIKEVMHLPYVLVPNGHFMTLSWWARDFDRRSNENFDCVIDCFSNGSCD